MDGDLDGVLVNTVVPAGSVIIRVKPGFDDVVGREVFETLMEGKSRHSMEKGELLSRILALAGKYVVDVVYY